MSTVETSIPQEMRRYCVKCQKEIAPARVKRGSFFCGENGDECRKLDRRARRAYKASRDCRLCGRRARRPALTKTAEVAQNDSSPVAPGAHTNSDQGAKAKRTFGCSSCRGKRWCSECGFTPQ